MQFFCRETAVPPQGCPGWSENHSELFVYVLLTILRFLEGVPYPRKDVWDELRCIADCLFVIFSQFPTSFRGYDDVSAAPDYFLGESLDLIAFPRGTLSARGFAGVLPYPLKDVRG